MFTFLKFLRSPTARRIAAEIAFFVTDAIGRKRRR
jgi:hypothetical protein